MPSAKPQPHGTIFRTLYLPASQIGTYPDLARDVCRGRFDVVILRNVFSRETMDTVRARLERGSTR